MLANGTRPKGNSFPTSAGEVTFAAEGVNRSSAKPPIGGKKTIPVEGKENH